ncbi:Signal transduction histidine kinase [Nitrosomonas cryotolerans]|uniref:histidine kinase n=1 Tax=Nitrosomonas cryotolerans ATCC 49181 TaxID=1131553 RepID=A0A1N6J2B1_9PROT|nr:HAMP domain-containing sensor histidine kinase [Nitrosomonas cryotolerans]SFP93013.1 Signal transduction histidine kinase [Nitrosomonas cryotolerans]SIO38401.1 Signal transduction histidine kinase [Nitrosomonas cryotolerans ATCC 49181]
MAFAEFSWNKLKNQYTIPRSGNNELKLSDEILISNIRWFIIFRWVVIGALIFFQILTILASNTLTQFGITQQQNWPIAITLILSVANFAYIFALDYYEHTKYNSPSINIWIQIIIDLLCLSIVVHYVGSVATPASFFYVLHIVLACIFFSTIESLFVTVLVCCMYTIVLLIENDMFLQVSQSILIDAHMSVESQQKTKVFLWMFILDILFLVVWYVVSRLAIVVRTHERHLLDAHEKINQTQVEKDQYAILMTHQLKSPLDAIRSKINLINGGYCGEFSPEIEDALQKMNIRAQGMSNLILDLLKLERLKTTCLNTATFKQINIETTIHKCLDKLTPVANAKQISILISIKNFIFSGIPDQLEILFENIISNAIIYSYDNASVEITSAIDRQNNTATVTITDHGIGIESKDLPNIFNEYFYAPRAVMHNKASSGVGLSIVKIAAENNKLQISVSSEPGAGTVFTVIFRNILPHTI